MPARAHPTSAALITAGLAACASYLLWAPHVPDLAAQVARASLATTVGVTSWWTGWFGGLTLPDYSVLAPSIMSTIGVRLAGVLAVAVFAVAAGYLTRHSLRPRAAAAAFGVAGFADVLDGRTTFALGIAAAAAALVGLERRWTVPAPMLGFLAYLCSPLAGLFLGLAVGVLAMIDTTRRRAAIVIGSVQLAAGLTSAVLFSSTGRMPYHITDAIPAALGCAGVAVICRHRTIRLSALIMLLAIVAVLAAPGAIGTNITRLTWLCAAPLTVAYSPLRRAKLTLCIALLALWPASDLTRQISSSLTESAAASFSPPVTAELTRLGAGRDGTRIEVLDTQNHWPDVYLSRTFSLARGWDRQADAADNPIFYTPGALTASSYRHWLNDLAVGWIALPRTPLDYASHGEQRLIATGLPYLHQAWKTEDWTVYRVLNPAPLVTGATVQSADAGGLTVRATAATSATVQIRWSPYLRAERVDGPPTPATCITQRGAWVTLNFPTAGLYRITSRLDPRQRFVTPPCS